MLSNFFLFSVSLMLSALRMYRWINAYLSMTILWTFRGKKDNITFNEIPEQTARREVAEDESDDEMLSSVLR